MRSPTPQAGTAVAPRPPAVLVVDDNATKRLALKAVLTPLGFPIVEADSGRAALRCLMAQDFAVILLDVRMPVMDGFETAALIRQRRESEMTPIIFITAYKSDEIQQVDRYAEGAVDFMFAPVPPGELRAKVSVFANIFIKAELLATRARQVQMSADHLRLLTEVAPVGMFQTDAENRYVYTNPRWTEITGISREEASGHDWETLMGSEHQAGLITKLDGPAYRGELSNRFQIRVPGSASRIVLVTAKAIPGAEGGIAGWVGTVADVTAEVGAAVAMSDAWDKATEASRLKSDFLANMSHEIRTPMNGVLGMTDLLLETNLDARQRDYAQTVRNSGEALLTIINDILDFSKVEAGKLNIEDIEFDVRTIVDDVVDLLARPAQTKGLDLVAVVERSVPAVVNGDPGRVRQVLTNLLGNAIKFTQTGEVVVRVSQNEGAGTETLVRFVVSDTGDGIAADKLGSVFEPFVQADTSTSRKYGGTGLGLAISAQLVALMGGRCGVSSTLGKGSDFWFTIKVATDAGNATAEPAPAEDGLAGLHVLVADDNATQRSVLETYLTEWGMTVSTADSGHAALSAVRSAGAEGRPFAVAILDDSMPGMDDGELKEAIVADCGDATSLVLLTGLGRGRHLADAAAPVVWSSLSTPIHLEDLRTCLRTSLHLQTVDVVAPAVTAPDPASAAEGQSGRLLLAEDNVINQKVAVAMLSSVGYQIDTVLNGAAAVEAVAARSYDAILMDCQMPVLNGYEATGAIRAYEGPDKHTPIIAMTAGARREDQERCLAAGMDAYLSKPVSKDKLLALVARWLRTSRAASDRLIAATGAHRP